MTNNIDIQNRRQIQEEHISHWVLSFMCNDCRDVALTKIVKTVDLGTCGIAKSILAVLALMIGRP